MTALKDTLKGTGLVLLVVTLVIAFAVGIWVLRVATADQVGEGNQRLKTRADADYRIAAYDAFFNDCAAIQSKEDQIANLELEQKSTTDPVRLNQIVTAITALRNSRNALIRQYNADTRKADTRGHFLASDLPYVIDPSKENTSCTV